MKTNVGIAMAIVIALAANTSAQDIGLFNGNGIKSQWGNNQSIPQAKTSNVLGNAASRVLGSNNASNSGSDSRWKLPKFDFSKLKPNIQTPKFLQGDGFPKALEFSDTDNGLLSSFPKLQWPNRDPSQPNFFQRMNERTKDVFGKTKGSFSDFGQRSRNSFDTLTRDVGSDISGFGSGTTNNPTVQPDLRSARQPAGSATKFQP